MTSGKYQCPHGYVSHFNELGQTVSPFMGRTIASSDPLWYWAWRHGESAGSDLGDGTGAVLGSPEMDPLTENDALVECAA